MLTAYMDASGTHDDSHNCVVAGYWGGEKAWSIFEWNWKKALQSEEIEEFHAKVFWPRINGERVGVYRGWSDTRHAAFMNRLLTVIETSRITPFAAGVLGAEWGKQPTPYRRVFNRMTEPELSTSGPKSLFLPFQVCIVHASMYCKDGIRMHFVFDQDSRIATQVVKVFSYIKQEMKTDEHLRFSIGDLTFADSRVATPLQAADLLAYEAHRYAKKAQGSDDAPMRQEYRRALTRARSKHDFWLFDGPRFKSFADSLEATASTT
jgi:uncharacterized protein DUF3800